jgi:periplasmic protein TonB
MRLRFSDWSLALVLALAIHLAVLATWYLSPQEISNPGAGGVSIALAPMAPASEDQAHTEIDEIQEPLPPVEEEPFQAETPVQVQPEIVPVVRPSPVAPAATPRASQPTAPSLPAVSEIQSDHQSTGSAAADTGVGQENAKADYVALVADRLARFKRYPRAARRRGLQGVAKLAFTLRRDGSLIVHEIVQSAGYQVLDREVQNTLERALPMPPFPPELSSATMDIIVPIRFELTRN